MGRRVLTGGGWCPHLKSHVVLALVLVGLFPLGGCTLILTGGAAGTAEGVRYTIDNVAHKTFNVDLPRLKKATQQALKALELEASGPVNTETGARLVAITEKLNIEIVLERVTSRATRMSVNAKAGYIQKDRATAAEIIRQTERALGQ